VFIKSSLLKFHSGLVRAENDVRYRYKNGVWNHSLPSLLQPVSLSHDHILANFGGNSFGGGTVRLGLKAASPHAKAKRLMMLENYAQPSEIAWSTKSGSYR
jgi:hypothetical protein